jgi:hypothetical protein
MGTEAQRRVRKNNTDVQHHRPCARWGGDLEREREGRKKMRAAERGDSRPTPSETLSLICAGNFTQMEESLDPETGPELGREGF